MVVESDRFLAVTQEADIVKAYCWRITSYYFKETFAILRTC